MTMHQFGAKLTTMRLALLHRWTMLSPLTRDSALYAVSGVLALLMAITSDEPAQSRWGLLAVGPYVVAALIGFALVRSRWRYVFRVQLLLALLVLFGALIVPLALEVRWRSESNGQQFAQPEVSVIQRSGSLLAHANDPYRTYDKNGHVVNAIKGLPAYESFFPYFPLMGIFGMPSAVTHRGLGLTDPRIVMTLVTLFLLALAIRLLRAPPSWRLRVAQVLVLFPSGALFLSTGGDDMPILALLLLAVVALQRYRTNLAGLALGIAAAMKLTAWPLALGALLVVRKRNGERAWKVIVGWVGAIVIVTIAPFVIRSPHAFFSNVFEFPLGLAGVTSPAASALPGHILAGLWKPAGRILPPLTFVLGGIAVLRYLRRRPNLRLSQLLALLSVTFVVLMCVSSATRIGYVIYPLNLALWSSLSKHNEAMEAK